MSNYRIDTRTIVPGLAVTLADGVLSVTIDRPESLNSLTKPVLAGMADAIEGAATDPRVKVVRLGGAGRGFSSGGAISVDDVWASGPPTDTVAGPTARCVPLWHYHNRSLPSCRDQPSAVASPWRSLVTSYWPPTMRFSCSLTPTWG